MLGRTIADPDGIEGPAGTSPGLGHLAIDTVMQPDKHITQVRACHIASDTPVSGYEIHIGESDGPDRARPMFDREGTPEGAVSTDGRAMGSYLHGLFGEDGFRRAFLAQIGAPASDLVYGARVEAALDALADHLEAHCDCDGLLTIAGSGVCEGG